MQVPDYVLCILEDCLRAHLLHSDIDDGPNKKEVTNIFGRLGLYPEFQYTVDLLQKDISERRGYFLKLDMQTPLLRSSLEQTCNWPNYCSIGSSSRTTHVRRHWRPPRRRQNAVGCNNERDPSFHVSPSQLFYLDKVWFRALRIEKYLAHVTQVQQSAREIVNPHWSISTGAKIHLLEQVRLEQR